MRLTAILAIPVFGFVPFLPAGEREDALWAAARKGDAAAVRALLDQAVDVNSKFRYGATALSYASDRGHVEVVKLLLERGADPNVKDTYYGATPIDWAADKTDAAHVEVVRLLLAKGAEGVDQVIGSAAESGNVEMLRVGLAKGGAAAETLSLALDEASREGRTEIAEVLKAAGALPLPKADFKVAEDVLLGYAGTYRNQREQEVRVEVKEGRLAAAFAGTTFVLGALDQTTFRPETRPAVTLSFVVEGNRSVALKVKERGNETPYQRVTP